MIERVVTFTKAMINREVFLKKAMNILLKQKFTRNIPLFTGEDIDDFIVGDEDGNTMELSEFLNKLYDSMK